MKQLQAVQQQILKAPHNTELRRVYADLLIEKGDPQGNFIAHQCALSELEPTDPKYGGLLAASQRLQKTYERAWLQPLLEASTEGAEHFSRLSISQMRNAKFERGFLFSVALTLEDLPFAQALEKLTPLGGIELLVSEGVPDDTPAPPGAPRWRALKISPDDWFTSNSVAQVLCWGNQSLVDLDLSGCDLGVDGAKLIVGEKTDLGETFDGFVAPSPPPAKQLQRLALKGTNLGDEGLQIILQSARLQGLKTLQIDQCRLTDDSLALIKKSSVCKKLEALTLAGNNELDLAGLVGWRPLKALRRFAPPKSITPATWSKLFPAQAPGMRELNLAGAKSLLASPQVVFDASASFTDLNLSTTGLKDSGLQSLLSSPSARTLLHLRINGCSLSDKSIDALVNSKLDRLVSLDISSNKLTDRGLATLADWEGLANVTHLRLGNNRKLTIEGHRALAKSDHFRPVLLDAGTLKDPETKDLLRDRYSDALI